MKWLLVVAALLFGLYRLGAASDVAPEAAPAAPAAADGWEIDLLSALGNTAPTAETIALLGAWHRAEGGDAAYNPLNTTQDAPGATCYNADPCVKNYPSYAAGIDATVETLRADHPGYAEIVAGLQTNDVRRAFDGIAASPWGTHAGLIADVYAEMAPAPAAPAAAGDTRAQIVQLALAQVGKPYILGTQGPDTFDCSGLVQWVYAQHGIATGRTTFDQLPRLRPITPDQIQAGDLVYFQFSWDQHTGILADVNGDGHWDMINAGTPQIGVVVTDNVFGDSFWTNALIGYRTAL